MTKKGRQFLREKIGVASSVSIPVDSDTNPSDAIADRVHNVIVQYFETAHL